MLKIKTLIIDDEQPAIDELKFLCEQYIDPEYIFTINNPKKGLEIINDNDIQLLFLDINMPYISGTELAQKITSLKKPPHIIFVTAYDEYAIKAFELNALDYILKPIDPQRFSLTINKIKNNPIAVKQKEKITQNNNFLKGKITAVGTNHNDRYIFHLKDITHFVAEGPIVFACTKNGTKKRVHYQLQQLEKYLPNNFTRTHKSYIVNLNRISRMYLWQKSNYMLEMDNNGQIPVSKRYSQITKEKLNW